MDNILNIKNMRKKVGDFKLGPIDLKIKRGEILTILGKTGAGKTLLMELISGFYRDYEGIIDIRSEAPIGIVFQDYGLFPHLTVEENISYGMRCHKVNKAHIKKELENITRLFEIDHLLKQYPNTLSGGEKQRTALARTMVIKPELLLLDEPFSALDRATKEKIYRQISIIKEKFSCTIILITHDFDEAIRLSDRVAILLDGKIRDLVDSDKLFSYNKDRQINEFLGLNNKFDKKRII